MAIGNPNGIPFCWEPPVKTASDIESSPNLRISADGGVSEFSNGCLDGRVFSLVQASPVGVLPSLLIVPQSYKSGKLYAQLPNARVNHIPNNSMFGASGGVLPSGWTFSVGAVSGISLGYSASGQATAEDGTLVDYIDFTFSGTATASGFLNLRPNASPSTISSVSGQSWNASVYLQLISGSVASISPTYQLQETTSGGTFINGSNITGLGSLTTSLPLRRYNVTRDLDTSGTVVTCRWGHSIASGTTYNYTLRIASPQLENLSSPTSVIRTVSGAVYAPYSGENVRTNLALQSEDFTTTWSPTNITVTTGSTTAFTAPDGTTNADLLTSTASGSARIIQSFSFVSGTTYTYSAFAKAGSGFFGLTMENGGVASGIAVVWNLSTGAFATSGTVGTGYALQSHGIENYGNGWYRCRMTVLMSVSVAGNIRVNTSNGTITNTVIQSASGNTAYAWGAQLETGSSATPYIRTTTAPNSFPIASIADFTVSRNTTATRVNSSGLIESVASGLPRIDWLGQSCPALLVEPSGQNLVLQSEGFSVSGTWVPEGTNPTQVTANSTGTLDPAGGNNADIITLVSGSTNQLRQSFISTSGTIYTASIFLKNIALTSGQTFLFSTSNQQATPNQVNCTIDLANLTITAETQGAGVTVSNAALDNYGNGWYRARFTFSFAVGGNNSYIRLRQPSSVGTNYAFYTWGAQLEVGSVATTYIPTTIAAVSRAADVISASGSVVSGLIGQTEGTIYAEVDIRSFGNVGILATISDGTASNLLTVYKFTDSKIYFDRISATQSALTSAGSSATYTAPTILKIAVGYKSGDSQMYINGVAVTTQQTQTFTFGTLTKVNIGSSQSNGLVFNDRIRAAALYTTRLTNDQLAELTRL